MQPLGFFDFQHYEEMINYIKYKKQQSRESRNSLADLHADSDRKRATLGVEYPLKVDLNKIY